MTQEEMDRDYYQKLLNSYGSIAYLDYLVEQKQEIRAKQARSKKRDEWAYRVLCFLGGLALGSSIIVALIEVF